MQIKPNRLVYKNPDTPAPAEAQKPKAEAKPVHAEVKKKHEAHREDLVNTLAPHIKSKDPKIRKAAREALKKLEKLQIGYLTEATKSQFIAKYKVVVEAHGKKEKAGESHISGLRRTLANWMSNENTSISTVGAKAIEELNKPENENMTKAEADEFLAKYDVIFEYHTKKEEAANTIKKIEGIPEEAKKLHERAFGVYQESIDKLFPSLPKAEKQQLVALRAAVKKDEAQLVDSVKVEYAQPVVSLEEYQKNPAKLTGKVAQLQDAEKAYRAKLNEVTIPNFHKVVAPKYEAFVQRLASRKVEDSIIQIDSRAYFANEDLKSLPEEKAEPAKKRIAALTKNTKALITHLKAPDKQQVRANILCQFQDETRSIVKTAKIGKVTRESKQPQTAQSHVSALAKISGKKYESAFAKAPAIKEEPGLKKKVGKPVKFAHGNPVLRSKSGMKLAKIEPPDDKNVTLSSSKIYSFEEAGGKKVDFVQIKLGKTDGPEGLIPRDSIA